MKYIQYKGSAQTLDHSLQSVIFPSLHSYSFMQYKEVTTPSLHVLQRYKKSQLSTLHHILSVKIRNVIAS